MEPPAAFPPPRSPAAETQTSRIGEAPDPKRHGEFRGRRGMVLPCAVVSGPGRRPTGPSPAHMCPGPTGTNRLRTTQASRATSRTRKRIGGKGDGHHGSLAGDGEYDPQSGRLRGTCPRRDAYCFDVACQLPARVGPGGKNRPTRVQPPIRDEFASPSRAKCRRRRDLVGILFGGNQCNTLCGDMLPDSSWMARRLLNRCSGAADRQPRETQPTA